MATKAILVASLIFSLMLFLFIGVFTELIPDSMWPNGLPMIMVVVHGIGIGWIIKHIMEEKNERV